MLKIVFLDFDTLGLVNITGLETLGELITYPVTPQENVVERCLTADVVITNKVMLSRDILLSLPALKLICVAATGTNNIDLEAAAQLNIEVKNVQNYATESVAQHTFAMLLALVNQITYHDHYVKSGLYSLNSHFTHLARPFYELAGKKLGVLGMGNIGRRVAVIAQSLQMEVVYSSLSGTIRQENIESIDLDQLIQTCDIITIHSPLNQYSKNLVNGDFLRKMKKSAILLNLGRGGIVIENDLVDAINNEEIAGACLDVFEQEPININNLLLKVTYPERLILTPHIAWASVEARQRLINQICLHIISLKI